MSSSAWDGRPDERCFGFGRPARSECFKGLAWYVPVGPRHIGSGWQEFGRSSAPGRPGMAPHEEGGELPLPYDVFVGEGDTHVTYCGP